MQFTGAVLAVVGAVLIVLAVLQAATALLGDSLLLAVVFGGLGVVLLVPGGWMMLRD